MGGNSKGARYAPQQPGKAGGGMVGGRPAPGALNPTEWTDAQRQAGGRWELPKAPPGAQQGIAKNWVTPPPQAPSAGSDGRAQLATLLANVGHGPDAIKQIQAAGMYADGTGGYTQIPGYVGSSHRGWTGGSSR